MLGIGAFHTGDTGRQIGVKLKEVQMAPRFLTGVMNRGDCPANRARESGTTPETDFDIKAFILFGKNYPFNLPRGNDTKSYSE